ncbi:MAG: TetR/AcrR family transcriptional regulator [Spirochaetales bacterium]|nr:TetR/AcrR family transcriptional regulator [Spirochaetales bacterium]
MPRSFTEEESLKISERLRTEGKKLFSSHGLKKTTVDDLVRATGIAKGSFYKFFPSKELLYMEIIEREEKELRLEMQGRFLAGEELDAVKIKAFFNGFIGYMETEPLFLKMFEEGAVELLMLKLPPEKVAEHMRNDEDWSESVIREWQEAGYLKDMDRKVFAALMRSVFILFTQREAIGAGHFSAALDFLFESLAEKIISTGEGRSRSGTGGGND